MPKLVVEMELSSAQIKKLEGNAIQRVIETTIICLEDYTKFKRCDPDSHQNLEDWKDQQEIVAFIYRAVQNAIFEATQ